MLKSVLSVIAWLSVFVLWLSAASVYVSPAWFRWASILGLVFPIALGGVVAMLIILLLFAWQRAWIPVLGMALSWGSIYTYLPLNIGRKAPDGLLKVMTYNVMYLGGDADNRKELLHYLAFSGCDIICMQEVMVNHKTFDTEVAPALKARTPYCRLAPKGKDYLAIASRYPILSDSLICSNKSNATVAFDLRMPGGDTLTVINCHLISNHLSPKERDGYREMVTHHHTDTEDNLSVSRILLSKISAAAKLRASQADSVATFVEALQQRGRRIIVCGDFNDTPISYAYHHIASTGLRDAFRATGGGIGRSFNRDAMPIRIDHIMASPGLKPYDAHIDTTPLWSDHYPMVVYYEFDASK